MRNRTKINTQTSKPVLLDGSRLIVEACVQAGAEVYVGYPITPANLIYSYSIQRFPANMSAPDEISALQWMSGMSAVGKLPVTATSFPGFALMIETLNMAYMMELPMLIILVQRLGPATGTATAGAQGDLNLLHGAISGGYPLPVLCISSMDDCWNLPSTALQIAIELRSPVILLSSKEMVTTQTSFDITSLAKIQSIKRKYYNGEATYRGYLPISKNTPAFLPIGNNYQQVRLNASTHDPNGILCPTSPEALDNTVRLSAKIEQGTPILYEMDEQPEADILLFSFGISSGACREAKKYLQKQGMDVSLLIAQTLFPIPQVYSQISNKYSQVYLVEENLQGQYAKLLFGASLPSHIRTINAVGNMILLDTIVEAILKK